MTETSNLTAPVETAAVDSPRPRGRTGAFVAVALIAVAFGAAAMFIGLRYFTHAGGPAAEVDAHAALGASAASPADVGPDPEGEGVYISPARQQLIGVRIGSVSAKDLSQDIRTTGTLAYDETRVTQVHTKVAGWIDQVFVDFVGKPVQKGQPLFTLYSPDLVSTQNDYLLARKAEQQLANSRFEDTRQSVTSLVAAARKRLELWDISPAQIAELERTGQPQKTLTLFAPSSGVVLERNAFAGQYIAPETNAFKLADLSTIWVVAQLFEADLAQVRVGQPVTVELSNAPGTRPIPGRVSFVYPDVDPATRRVRIRAEVPNPDFALRPDMFATVTIKGTPRRTLSVPAEAVIDTGAKRYVILARGRGYFEPRAVEAGAPVGDDYPILNGLAAGDQVVTSAQFLIDSESNLQTAMQAMADMPGLAPARQGGNGAKDQAPQTNGSARDRISIDFRTDPDPARAGENAIEVAVRDAKGQPVVDAAVSVVFFMAAMPSMGMPAMRTTTALEHTNDGVYCASGQVPMAGRWDVTVAVTRGAETLGTKHVPVLVR